MKAQLEKEVEIRAKVTELLNATNPAIQLFKVQLYLMCIITLNVMYCITSKIIQEELYICTTHITPNLMYGKTPKIIPKIGLKECFSWGYRIQKPVKKKIFSFYLVIGIFFFMLNFCVGCSCGQGHVPGPHGDNAAPAHLQGRVHQDPETFPKCIKMYFLQMLLFSFSFSSCREKF